MRLELERGVVKKMKQVMIRPLLFLYCSFTCDDQKNICSRACSLRIQ
jgi:hypothetical protein